MLPISYPKPEAPESYRRRGHVDLKARRGRGWAGDHADAKGAVPSGGFCGYSKRSGRRVSSLRFRAVTSETNYMGCGLVGSRMRGSGVK